MPLPNGKRIRRWSALTWHCSSILLVMVLLLQSGLSHAQEVSAGSGAVRAVRDVPEAALAKRRQFGSEQALWSDASFYYWFIMDSVNYYRTTKGRFTSGAMGPQLRLGFSRFYGEARFLKAMLWAKSGGKNLDLGSITVREYSLVVEPVDGVAIFMGSDLYQADPGKSELRMNGHTRLVHWSAGVRGDHPLARSGLHRLNYSLGYYFSGRNQKWFSINGYSSLAVPPADYETTGFAGSFLYERRSTTAPSSFAFGIRGQGYFAKREDVGGVFDDTIFFGPIAQYTYRL